MGGDSLWDLGLSDAVLIGVFALVVLLVAIGVAVWAVAVPERRPEREDPFADRIVEHERERAARVGHQLDDDAGRTDPSVTWTH